MVVGAGDPMSVRVIRPLRMFAALLGTNVSYDNDLPGATHAASLSKVSNRMNSMLSFSARGAKAPKKGQLFPDADDFHDAADGDDDGSDLSTDRDIATALESLCAADLADDATERRGHLAAAAEAVHRARNKGGSGMIRFAK